MLNQPIEVLKRTELCGQQFTVYGTPENPLFRAKEVADIIEHPNVTVMLNLVDEEEKGVKQLLTPGGNQKVTVLTEDGLYEVLMQSRKPIAKQFKKGVKQILHEVRTTGGYIATAPQETDEEIMAKALSIAQRTIARRDERIKQLEEQSEQQQRQIEQKQETIELQQAEITKSAPKVSYYDTTLQSVNTMTSTQVAKQIGMDAGKLHKKLKEAGVIFRQSGQWMLHAPYSTWGMHAARTQTYTRSDGSTGTSTYTVWTEKGKRFIVALHECGWKVKDAIRQIKGDTVAA